MNVEKSLNDLEILRMAISMEEQGMKFYTQGVKHTQGKLRDFLLNTAGQEMLHRDKFQKIYDDLVSRSGSDDDYLFDQDVAAYLASLAKEKVFVKNQESENAFKDLHLAANLALKNETATVELYTKMQQGAKYDEVKEILGVLIEEEKDHVQYFKELLEELK